MPFGSIKYYNDLKLYINAIHTIHTQKQQNTNALYCIEFIKFTPTTEIRQPQLE